MQGLINLIGQIIISVLSGFFNTIIGLNRALLYKDQRLNAEFGDAKYILHEKHEGFNLMGKSITPELSRTGILINGESGSYKSAGALVRSILMVKGSQIIHDPAQDLAKLTIPYKSKTHDIIRIDFTNASLSAGYNPLLRATTDSQISALALKLVSMSDGSSSSDGSFWVQKAQELLTLMISLVRQLEPEYANLLTVAYLLDCLQAKDSKEQIDELVAEFGNERMVTKYASIISMSENTLSSVIASAQVAVQQYDLDEEIKKITSHDTLGDFKNIRKKPTLLYIHSSTAKMDYYGKITSLLLQQYFEEFFKELPRKEDLDVYFHLDETPVLSISGLPVIAANIRKYRGSLMVVCQNAYAQLESKYGVSGRDAILANLKTKVFFSMDLTTASQMERVLGRLEYEDIHDNDRVKSRSLMTVDELLALPKDKVLIWVSGMRPILTKVIPYFTVKKLVKLTQMPMPKQFTEQRDVALPKLLPLDKMYPRADSE